MTAKELFQVIDAPPLPDFYVRPDAGYWFIDLLTHEARQFAVELDCELWGDRIVLRSFADLVDFCDQLFDSGLKCC